MKNPVKNYFLRGLIFGGFGPIVTAIVLFCISLADETVILNAKEIFTMILSTYILAFVHAGASVFNQIDHWPIMKSIGYHFASLYIAYSACYLINKWIAFDLKIFGIFTAVFVGVYVVVWVIVYLLTKKFTNKCNKKIA